MGSIPSHIDTELLSSWIKLMDEPQDKLVRDIINALGEGTVLVDEVVKKRLAVAVREHYKKYPNALSMQASGNSVPPTVDNHK
jgi:coproporphyrinogen III oxidase